MDKKTIDTYNKIAVDYDNETVGFWDNFPKTFLNKFIELSGHKIIDVGSGPGRDGLLLQETGKEVVCISAFKFPVSGNNFPSDFKSTN